MTAQIPILHQFLIQNMRDYLYLLHSNFKSNCQSHNYCTLIYECIWTWFLCSMYYCIFWSCPSLRRKTKRVIYYYLNLKVCIYSLVNKMTYFIYMGQRWPSLWFYSYCAEFLTIFNLFSHHLYIRKLWCIWFG